MRTHSQRLLSMVLALSMLLTFLPLSAFADDGSTSAAKNKHTEIVSGEGTYTYTLNDDNTATLTEFTGTGTTVKVPRSFTTKDGTSYTVTAIGDGVFANHGISSTLSSVDLPDSIQTIGHAAFHGCTSLHKITLPEGLTTVGNAAFAMAGLTEVTLPKSLKKVGKTAFASVPAINTVTYTGTETAWQELLSSQTFEDTDTVEESNPQLAHDALANFYCAHTVTFDKNGHGDPEEKVVEYNHTTTPISDPTADGYKFMGWFTAPDGDETFDFDTTKITKDETVYAHWVEDKKPAPTPEQPGTQQPGTTTPTTPPESTDKPNEPTPPQNPDNNKTDTDKPNKPNEPTTPEQPGTQEKPNEPTPPEAPTVEEDDTAAIGYAAAAVTAAFVGWGAYRIGSEVYLKYLLPKDVLLPQNRIQLAELLWEDAGRPAPADAAAYTDVDANDADAQQAARWAVENGLLTLPDTEKPEEFAPYRSVSYAKSARAWNKAQQLKENAAAR